MSAKKQIITRIAPSPTGPLHIGTARSALFNYLFAKQNKGKFLLRIEDTDAKRSDKRFEQDIIDGLKWLNIEWDAGPFRQSERMEIYQNYIQKLLKNGLAFYCFHTKNDLADEKRKQIEKKEAPRHICEHKNTTGIKTAKKTREGIMRFNTSQKIVKFYDLIRGEIRFDTSLLGDFAIAKDKQNPLYNLAVVVDDFEMKISHIIRGEDHISNTPKQILIQEALGIKQPQYAHLPLVLGPDRSKLSKRHGTTSVNEYRKAGYLAKALINFMALLGWNPGNEQEIFSLEDLIKKFDLKKTQKSGAIFNIDRLNWLNGVYIRNMPPRELIKLVLKGDFLKTSKDFDRSYLSKILALEQSRIQKLSELGEHVVYFFNEPRFPKSMLAWHEKGDFTMIKTYLDKIAIILQGVKEQDFKKEKIKTAVWPYANEKGRGEVLWPFRVALTGQRRSPDPFEIAEVLGKEKTLNRLNYAIKLLN